MIGSYIFNTTTFVTRFLRKKYRNTRNVAWLKALLTPVQYLSDALKVKSDDIDFKTKYSSQQMILAALLNKLFDPTDSRIRIETNSDSFIPVNIYHQSEGYGVPIISFIGEGYPAPVIHHPDEISDNYSFNVIVPSALSAQEESITGWVSHYLLAGKTFQIIYE